MNSYLIVLDPNAIATRKTENPHLSIEAIMEIETKETYGLEETRITHLKYDVESLTVLVEQEDEIQDTPIKIAV
jgi:hypothetical protein